MTKRTFSILSIIALALMLTVVVIPTADARSSYMATCTNNCHNAGGSAGITLASNDCKACHHHGASTTPSVLTDATTYTTAQNILFRMSGGNQSGRAGLQIYNNAGTTVVSNGLITEDGVTTRSVAASLIGVLTNAPIRTAWRGNAINTLTQYNTCNGSPNLTNCPHESITINTANKTITQAVTTGTLTGTVRNASTTAVIAGATVTANGTTATTNASGVYTMTLNGSTTGISYSVTASATGFSPVTQSATIITGQTTTLNFNLPPIQGGSITGTVRNASTTAVISGATVSGCGTSATTNASGVYTMTNVPAGSCTLTASAAGFNPGTATVTVVSNTTITQNFNLTPTPPLTNPPPVHQYLGINDGVFNDMVEADCRVCHDNPGQFPGIMPNLITKDRHHVLTGPPDNLPCDFCHVLFIDPTTGTVTPIVQRNCLACHTQFPGQASVHHVTPRATSGDCKACHGTKIVSNMGDGHYIPTYTPSIITPYPSQGTGPLINSVGSRSGACNFCHDAGFDLSTGVSIPVSDNMTTHHSTGFGTPAQPVGSPYCLWCHVNGDPDYQPINFRIRACENCHGPETLHNIQVSSTSPGSPANPGNEAPFFGHIGADSDCKGCHGPQAVAAYSPAPYSGPTAVSISGMSAAVVPAGQNVSIAITGSGFVNLVNAGGTSITLSSKVLLTSATGATTLLTPSSIDAANIVVTIPATMAIGAYKLNVAKVSSTDAVLGLSGPKALAVVGPVTITSASAANNVLTVIGSGFGAQPTFDGRAIDAVSVNGVACKVSSWTDTQITASCTAVKNGDPVVMTTLLNGASATATVAATNQSPVAVATATPSTQSRYRSITFDGTKSYDPDGTIVKWAWNFGNGSTKTGSKVTYSYSRTGTYTVTLTVTDNKGATGKATVKVTIR